MKNILEYLEHSARDNAQKIALADPDRRYTYQEYREMSRKVGSGLVEKICLREPVAVYMDKCCEAVIAFMGTVYAGGFYVQLNKTHPLNRLESVLDTLQCKYIITNQENEAQAKEKFEDRCEILLIEDLMNAVEENEKLQSIRNQVIDTDPLYAIFTSGSTGMPKGVCVCHRSVIDFIDVFTEQMGITTEDIIGNQAPFDFDVSVKDIYSALKMGATLQIIPTAYFSNPTALMDYLCDQKITTIIWAVSAMCIISTLKGFDYRLPSDLKKVMFSGEVMPIKHLNIWMDKLSDATFVNLYGPTEITCNCTFYRIDRRYEEGEYLPIGKCFPNERVFLLDENNQLVKGANQEGELCVAGTALALGYYNAFDKTNESFVQNPVNHVFPELIYRTGDIARYDEEGMLYYVSRKDFQIKHMGHRIELGEIEMQMMKQEEITRACCIYIAEKQRIIAFYEGNAEEKEVRTQLTQLLPPYMLPNKIMQLPQLPITQRGKIDRAQLKCIYEEAKSSRRRNGK